MSTKKNLILIGIQILFVSTGMAQSQDLVDCSITDNDTRCCPSYVDTVWLMEKSSFSKSCTEKSKKVIPETDDQGYLKTCQFETKTRGSVSGFIWNCINTDIEEIRAVTPAPKKHGSKISGPIRPNNIIVKSKSSGKATQPTDELKETNSIPEPLLIEPMVHSVKSDAIGTRISGPAKSVKRANSAHTKKSGIATEPAPAIVPLETVIEAEVQPIDKSLSDSRIAGPAQIVKRVAAIVKSFIVTAIEPKAEIREPLPEKNEAEITSPRMKFSGKIASINRAPRVAPVLIKGTPTQPQAETRVAQNEKVDQVPVKVIKSSTTKLSNTILPQLAAPTGKLKIQMAKSPIRLTNYFDSSAKWQIRRENDFKWPNSLTPIDQKFSNLKLSNDVYVNEDLVRQVSRLNCKKPLTDNVRIDSQSTSMRTILNKSKTAINYIAIGPVQFHNQHPALGSALLSHVCQFNFESGSIFENPTVAIAILDLIEDNAIAPQFSKEEVRIVNAESFRTLKNHSGKINYIEIPFAKIAKNPTKTLQMIHAQMTLSDRFSLEIRNGIDSPEVLGSLYGVLTQPQYAPFFAKEVRIMDGGTEVRSIKEDGKISYIELGTFNSTKEFLTKNLPDLAEELNDASLPRCGFKEFNNISNASDFLQIVIGCRDDSIYNLANEDVMSLYSNDRYLALVEDLATGFVHSGVLRVLVEWERQMYNHCTIHADEYQGTEVGKKCNAHLQVVEKLQTVIGQIVNAGIDQLSNGNLNKNILLPIEYWGNADQYFDILRKYSLKALEYGSDKQLFLASSAMFAMKQGLERFPERVESAEKMGTLIEYGESLVGLALNSSKKLKLAKIKKDETAIEFFELQKSIGSDSLSWLIGFGAYIGRSNANAATIAFSDKPWFDPKYTPPFTKFLRKVSQLEEELYQPAMNAVKGLHQYFGQDLNGQMVAFGGSLEGPEFDQKRKNYIDKNINFIPLDTKDRVFHTGDRFIMDTTLDGSGKDQESRMTSDEVRAKIIELNAVFDQEEIGFKQIFKYNKPFKEKLRIEIINDPSEYDDYMSLFSLSNSGSNNGGVYETGITTFFTYARTRRQSIFTLDALSIHEFAHYLQDKYLRGLEFPHFWVEGVAQFMIGFRFDKNTGSFTVEPTKNDLMRLKTHDSRMSLRALINSQSGNFKEYSPGALFFNFMFHQKKDMFDAFNKALFEKKITGNDDVQRGKAAEKWINQYVLAHEDVPADTTGIIHLDEQYQAYIVSELEKIKNK